MQMAKRRKSQIMLKRIPHDAPPKLLSNY